APCAADHPGSESTVQLGDVVPLQLVVLGRVDGELGVGVASLGAGDRLGGGGHVRLGVGTVDVDGGDPGPGDRLGEPDHAGAQVEPVDLDRGRRHVRGDHHAAAGGGRVLAQQVQGGP